MFHLEPGGGDDPGTPCEDNEADQSAGKGKTLVKTLKTTSRHGLRPGRSAVWLQYTGRKWQ